MSYDNRNKGSIWKNDDKQKDTHPDFKGSLNVDGVEYWVSAWKRKPGANPAAPALTFSIQLKEQRQRQAQSRPVQSQADDFGDEIPFNRINGTILHCL